MRMQNGQKTEKQPNHQDNAKISSNLNSFNQEVLARGVGFEPTRPLLTTGLAGLPPTRLGQPRPFFSKSELDSLRFWSMEKLALH